MTTPSLSIEELFADLDLDPEPSPALTGEALIDLVGFTAASPLLSDGDPGARPTRPYDVPANELSGNVALWGDDERFSTLCTTPASLDELPAEAYPTQINLFGE